jgi:hypothetical protein
MAFATGSPIDLPIDDENDFMVVVTSRLLARNEMKLDGSEAELFNGFKKEFFLST